ncbi:MAG: hypothetical protein GY817_06820 [bacterium]|nr:hypothetical protein [bacterium]
MKICLITNNTRGYTNDILIFNKLLETLDLSPKDVFYLKNFNDVYHINDNYTHSLVLLDYKSTNITQHQEFFSEIKIPRIFIIDTIPKIHRDLDILFNKELRKHQYPLLTSLPFNLQLFLYNEYADALLFYSNRDQKYFQDIYPLKNPTPSYVIPPSLGNKEDIQIDFTHFFPNNNIGFNGSPSFSNGIYHIFDTLNNFPNYTLSLFGNHGRNEVSNEILANFITDQSPNINFNGKLKDTNKFFKNNHIYHNISVYDSFNYFTFTSLLNGMVPILSTSSSTAEYFIDYPFISDLDVNSIYNTLNNITSTPIKELKEILIDTSLRLKHMNNKNIKNEYYNFLNNL